MRLGKLEFDFLLVRHRRLDFFHALDLLELALGLGGLGVLGPKPLDKFHHVRDFALLVLVGRRQLRLRRLALRQVILIIAAVADQFAVANLQNMRDKLVEEIAVVRNHQNRARISPQIFLEPLQRFQVEMIGRLVQHQQVRLLRQQPRQMRPHHPSAAHLPQRPVEILLPKTQPGQNALGLGLALITIQLIVMSVRLKIDGQFQHRFIPRRRAFLGQMPDRDILLELNRPRIRRIRLEDQRKQSRFPRPIGPDQPKAVLAIDLQRDILKQRPGSKRFADFRQRKHEPPR